MQIRFWGTRGSLPVAPRASTIADKVAAALVKASGRQFDSHADARRFVDDELEFAAGQTYGGATSCVEIDTGAGPFVVCDMGSGLREFGLDSMARPGASDRPREWHVFLSHLHWDHIMGFPFFTPAFLGDVRIVVHAGHADAEDALRRQQEEISFPVPFDALAAEIEFRTLEPGGTYEIGELKVALLEQDHDHKSYGFRFEDRAGKVAVYATDAEHRIDRADALRREASAFLEGADLVIADTMYSLGESISTKEGWGHSSNIVAVDQCREAGARRLALFHHEPAFGDDDIQRLHEQTLRYEELTRDGDKLEVLCSHDGLCVTL
ncbi:MAG: MBL fold metallo-hydrolase [Erythrobacter sp.]|uniref:MBL fold metallo-hydrolase n=1 Tax=Erythrobacter sp. TaxID=1042 RepID=UPI003C76391C